MCRNAVRAGSLIEVHIVLCIVVLFDPNTSALSVYGANIHMTLYMYCELCPGYSDDKNST